MKTGLGASTNTIGRLPKYLRCLQELEDQGISRVSSTGIAERLSLTPSQIRQDLAQFGSFGAQGYGYDVKLLANCIREILGINKSHNVIIVGVGSIGRALLTHLEFQGNNYHVVAGFDTDYGVIGKTVNDTPVYHVDELIDFLGEVDVDLCVLAVPKEHAKHTALSLAKNGVPAIWNLTNVDLELGNYDVLVENMHFLDSLFSLTFYLEATSKTKEKAFA